MALAQSAPINILLIEDNPGDARLIEILLREKSPNDFSFVWADTLGVGMEKLSHQHFDVALLDLSLPDSQGLETVARLRAFAPMLPIVVLTGQNDDQLALRAVQQGAQDYLVKGLSDGDPLRRAIRYAIERSLADANLRRSEGQFRAVFENAGLGIALVDGQGALISINPALSEMLGATPGGKPPTQILQDIHPDDRCRFETQFRRLLGGEQDGFTLELRFAPPSGRFAWGAVTVSLVRSADRSPQFAVAMVEDITARKALEEQLRLAAKVLEATSEGVFITDIDQHIIHVNPSFTRLTGFEPHEALGAKPSILASGRHGPDFFAALWRSIHEQGYWNGEIWNRKKDGQLFAEWLNISSVRNETGAITNYVAVFSDITSRKQNEEKLSHRAHHDPLTGLPNRALFLERLDHAITRAQRNQLVVAVLFLDLDHFKQINDSLGHLAGDALLQQVAERLSHSVRAEDMVARLGGDEFTLILEDINDFRDAAKVAQKVLTQFAQPFQLNGHPYRVTTSIGIGLYPADGAMVGSLLAAADEAMYAAKKQGRDSFRFASSDLSERAFERQTLEQALAQAVENGGMQVYYQPMIDLADGRVIGVEALLRWQHPEIGLMVPRQFLPLAKETGLIKPLGQWVMRTAFTQAAHWRTSHPDLRIAVNVSRSELQDDGFVAMIEALLAQAGLPARAVEIDVPEAVAMEAAPATVATLESLRILGTHIALDDFGAGHTDFRILKDMPVDVVKIAPDFIRGLGNDNEEAKLVRAAISVARSMSIRVMAKAVETSAQYQFLRVHDCHGAQGFLFSRPVPADDFTALLDRSLAPED